MSEEFKIIETRDYFYVKRNGVDVVKEEIRQLERLLYEAKNRLAREYEKKEDKVGMNIYGNYLVIINILNIWYINNK